MDIMQANVHPTTLWAPVLLMFPDLLWPCLTFSYLWLVPWSNQSLFTDGGILWVTSPPGSSGRLAFRGSLFYHLSLTHPGTAEGCNRVTQAAFLKISEIGEGGRWKRRKGESMWVEGKGSSFSLQTSCSTSTMSVDLPTKNQQKSEVEDLHNPSK